MHNYIKKENNTVRVTYNKSNKYLYLQADLNGISIINYSCHDKRNLKIAGELGKKIGLSLIKRNIFFIYFDRKEFQYYGKSKACADGIRSVGIKF